MRDPTSAQDLLNSWLDRCGSLQEADTWRWSVTVLVASTKGRVLALETGKDCQLIHGPVEIGETLTEAAERITWEQTHVRIHEPSMEDVVACGVYENRRDVTFLCRAHKGLGGMATAKAAAWMRPRRLVSSNCRHPWRARAAFESLGWGIV